MDWKAILAAVINSEPVRGKWLRRICLILLHIGRSAVFTSDCAPHWAPPEFLDWPGYRVLWPNLIRWVAGAE